MTALPHSRPASSAVPGRRGISANARPRVPLYAANDSDSSGSASAASSFKASSRVQQRSDKVRRGYQTTKGKGNYGGADFTNQVAAARPKSRHHDSQNQP